MYWLLICIAKDKAIAWVLIVIFDNDVDMVSVSTFNRVLIGKSL